MLSVTDLSVTYGAIQAVNGISFEIPRGAIVTLIGGNGNDDLRGLGGDDNLQGGEGNDPRTGGAGAVAGRSGWPAGLEMTSGGKIRRLAFYA
jgi:Ca2+-binding RTX toxin-like protein